MFLYLHEEVMETNTKMKLWLTSTTLVLGCVGASYLFSLYKRRPRNAADALKYLSIKLVNSIKDCDEVINELQR